MYIVSIFIAVINTLLNNHEKVNTSLAFIESQIFLPVLISSKKSFGYKSDPVWVRRYNQLQWMHLWINYNDLKNGSVDAEFYNYMYDLIIA